MKMIKVERMPQTVHYSGKTYGPSEKPLSIPEELAAALGLTPVNGSFSPEATAEVDHQELEASRTLATQAKEKLDKLLGQLAPLAQEGEMPDQVLARVVQERDELQIKAKNQAEIIERGTANSQRLIREAGASNENSFRLKAELDKANEQLEKERVGGQSIIADHQARVQTLEAERDTLTSQLSEAQARPVLPADARDRLIKVKGISDALADLALDALKAEPEKPQGE